MVRKSGPDGASDTPTAQGISDSPATPGTPDEEWFVKPEDIANEYGGDYVIPDDLFADLPPAVIPIPDRESIIVGRWKEILDLGIDDQHPSWGNRYVGVFIGLSGAYHVRDKTSETVAVEAIIPGKEYALWLLHSRLIDQIIEADPNEHELFVIRGNGKRLKRGKTEADDNAAYHDYSVGFPERPVVKRTISVADM